MISAEVRKGIRRAKHDGFHSFAGFIILFEMLFLPVGFGIIYKSWWVFGGGFLVSYLLFQIPITAKLIFLFISGWLAYFAGLSVYKSNGLGAGVVLGFLVFVIVYKTHRGASQYLDDIAV